MNIDNILNRMEADGVPNFIRAFTYLHFRSGARISDILKLDHNSIMTSGEIIIQQSKKSESIIIQPTRFIEVFNRIRDLQLSPLEGFNASYFRNLYRRYGISHRKQGAKHTAVTHAFRHNRAQEIYNHTGNIEDAKMALGHKSVRSTEYYITKPRPKAVQKTGIGRNPVGRISNLKIDRRGVITILDEIKPRRKNDI